MEYYALFLLFLIGSFFGSSISKISATRHHQLKHFDVRLVLKLNCTGNLQRIGSTAHNFPGEERRPLVPHTPKDNKDIIFMKQLPQLPKCPNSFSLEIEAMVDIVQGFHWHKIIILHEDSQSLNQFASQLVDSFRDKEIFISNKISIASSVTYFNTLKILSNIAKTQTRIILADMADVSVGSRVILAAKEAGLMSKGYAWLITSRMSKMLNSIDQNTLNIIMEGALGVRPHVQSSTTLSTKPSLVKPSENIPSGHSGNIMHSPSFEVFNVLGMTERVVAYWRPHFSFSGELRSIDDDDDVKHRNCLKYFRKIIWPGDSTIVPCSCDVPRAIRTGGPWRWIPQ